MDEDKNTSKAINKRPVEQDGETTIGCLFKHPTNVSGEISDTYDVGYSGHVRSLKLKYNQAIQEYDAKHKTYEEAWKMHMEVTESRNI
ncbi:hypothetical protein MKW92_010872, partial [Papaver armeniacum]